MIVGKHAPPQTPPLTFRSAEDLLVSLPRSPCPFGPTQSVGPRWVWWVLQSGDAKRRPAASSGVETQPMTQRAAPSRRADTDYATIQAGKCSRSAFRRVSAFSASGKETGDLSFWCLEKWGQRSGVLRLLGVKFDSISGVVGYGICDHLCHKEPPKPSMTGKTPDFQAKSVRRHQGGPKSETFASFAHKDLRTSALKLNQTLARGFCARCLTRCVCVRV